MTPRVQKIGAASLVLALASVIFAAQQESYITLKTAPVVSTTRNAAGSSNWSQPVDPLPTYGDPTANMTVLLNTASATVGVKVGLYHQAAGATTYTLLKIIDLGTFTASAADTATIGTGTWYLSEGVGVDTRGATYWDRRVRTAPSAGGVAFSNWTHGASSTGGQ